MKLSKAMKKALFAIVDRDVRATIEGRTGRALIRRGLVEVKKQYIAATDDGLRVAQELRGK